VPLKVRERCQSGGTEEAQAGKVHDHVSPGRREGAQPGGEAPHVTLVEFTVQMSYRILLFEIDCARKQYLQRLIRSDVVMAHALPVGVVAADGVVRSRLTFL
jgi:hypothetical protein